MLGPGLVWAWGWLGRNAEGRNDLKPARDLGISLIKVSHSVWHILMCLICVRVQLKGKRKNNQLVHWNVCSFLFGIAVNPHHCRRLETYIRKYIA